MRVRLADRPENVQTADLRMPDVEAGATREAPDHIENALLVVDDQKEGSLPSHTYSLATARITDLSARS